MVPPTMSFGAPRGDLQHAEHLAFIGKYLLCHRVNLIAYVIGVELMALKCLPAVHVRKHLSHMRGSLTARNELLFNQATSALFVSTSQEAKHSSGSI